MNSANIDNTVVRPKGLVKAKLSRDDIIMRGGMIVIALYLVISLVFPLYSMFSKSIQRHVSSRSLLSFEVERNKCIWYLVCSKSLQRHVSSTSLLSFEREHN